MKNQFCPFCSSMHPPHSALFPHYRQHCSSQKLKKKKTISCLPFPLNPLLNPALRKPKRDKVNSSKKKKKKDKKHVR